MKVDVSQLPEDLEFLQAIIKRLFLENSDLFLKNKNLCQENRNLLQENQSLKEQLVLLRAKQFGKSSEKLSRQIADLEQKLEENEEKLGRDIPIEENIEDGFFAASEDEIADSNTSNEGTTLTEGSQGNCNKKEQPKRKKLPEHLPRVDVIIPAVSECPECGGNKFRKIEDDIYERLEYVPASFKVIKYIRPRCACVNCEHIVQGYAPTSGISKGKAGSGLLAQILVGKYCDHLPFYRQSQIYKREGIEISRSVMASWAGQCARLLMPLIEKVRDWVFSSTHIHGDDTPVKVLAPGFGKTKTGRLWVYLVDGRPHGSDKALAACYFYSPDRTGKRPEEHLKDYKGVMHADAYSGYNEIFRKVSVEQGNTLGADLVVKPEVDIKEIGCWAHTRRKFYEVVVASGTARIASEVLEKIGKIYEIEDEVRGLLPAKRLEQRQLKSKALVEKLFVDFRKYQGCLPKKSRTSKAIAYALNNETALKRFLEDGEVEVDNNAAERAMRCVAVGRKNWLFAGSDAGGESAAVMYTLIETAKLNGLDPWKYLRQVLEVIQDHPFTKLDELLPWNIKLKDCGYTATVAPDSS